MSKFKKIYYLPLIFLMALLSGCFNDQNYEDIKYPYGIVEVKYSNSTDVPTKFKSTGKLLISPQFTDVRDFSEGLAAVKKDKWAYLSKDGRFITPFKYDFAGNFSEDLAGVKFTENKITKIEYINKDGSTKFGFVDDTYKANQYPGPFINGVACIDFQWFCTYRNKQGGGVSEKERIDHPSFPAKNKETTSNARVKTTFYFSEDLSAVRTDSWFGVFGGKWGFMNRKTALAIKFQFDDANNFSNGLAAVKVGSYLFNIGGKWGFINKSGEMVVKPQYSEVGRFSEGLAKVKIDKKWGYINKLNELVIDAIYDDAGDFTGGFAKVKIGKDDSGKWGYIYR